MIQPKKYLTKGTQLALDKVPINEGKIRITTDTGRMFIDTSDKRVEITDFVKGMTEEEIRDILAPLPKFYHAYDTNNILVHNGTEWVVCNNNVNQATNASTAEYAINAGTANYATNAGTATLATNASTANYAKNAGSATNATSATNASTANYAKNAGTASKASTASYATKALNDSDGNRINITYAPLESPIFTGTPTVPTPASDSSNLQIANTKFVINLITEAISKITQFKTQVLNELPENGTEGIIYFIPNDETEEINIYDEFIWVNSKFERIGSTKIDLTGYYKEINTIGTGNAVTKVIETENGLEFEKGATFLTQHPAITTSSSTATETPAANSSIEVIDSISTDSNGHLLSYRKKTVTLPNSVSNASTANYAKNAGTAVLATNASTANYAKNAGTATIATNASTANYAKNAGTASFVIISQSTRGIENEADMDFGDLDQE